MKPRCFSVICLAGGFLLGAVFTRAQQDPRQSIMQADRDFDAATAERGVDGWASYFAADGRMYRGDGGITEGPAAIRELMGPFFGDKRNALRWQPVSAEVAASGDLGFTTGVSQGKGVNAEGKRVERDGRYVTIWRRSGNGPWRIVLDIGVNGPSRVLD